MNPASPSTGASVPQSAPRRGQGLRKQHRNQRRPNAGERSGGGGGGGGGYVDHEDEDAMAELRALRNPSSRRGQTSITHLLNYSAPLQYRDPHGNQHQGHHHHGARSYRRPAWGPGSGYHAADKARYVHANYRFMVSPEGAYSDQAADPDLFVNWADVLQVLASPESQAASCPICLSEPVAPRMAKCGHIFCLPCLLRFMNTATDEESPRMNKGTKWRKCPICEDSIYLNDVRPVRFYVGQESALPRVGDDVVLRLMTRNANSTVALPKEGGVETLNMGQGVPWHFAANVLDYARIMKGSRGYMLEQFDEEIEAMQRQAKEDELMFGLDGEWTHKAINAVNVLKEKAQGLSVDDEASSAPADPEAAKQAPAPAPAPTADFYFFSALPHLYLSPLDIRILKTKYGSFSSFPTTLLPRVEHISTGHVVDDVLRKRAKYLGHLPRGCVISFLECDWTDIVSAKELESFASEIERRRSRNGEKAAQEERERIQAERLEAAALRSLTGSSRRAPPSPVYMYPAESSSSPPPMDIADFQPLGAASPPDAVRPGFSTLASMSTSPSAQRTVWGTPAVANSPPASAPGDSALRQRSDVDDGWLRDEDFLSLGPSELSMQFEALDMVDAGRDKANEGQGSHGMESAHGHDGHGGGGGGGKKKKKQKITLMSTGGRRGL
ncbi:putative RING finger protein [Escovopsis weberi]|uniref:Putative RING finger protein n=1 Tax=Escovopsis weberi TaxID=150374 RepID=A0A0M9VV46_ESCWE|nr:putative RING finger protein [Escovopsis weberi]